jgi:hypothetical protein
MAAKTETKRLNGPSTIDIDPDTGRILGDEDLDTSDLENDQDKLLDDIIGEFGAGDNEVSYSASVTRIPKNFQRGQKEPWLFECDAAEIIGIRTKLRDVYRGGQFRIRVYKTTARGKKLYRQMDYFIEAPEVTASVTSDGKYDAIAAALERTQSQLLALADRLSTPQQITSAQIDPISLMEKMSAIFKNMMPNTQPITPHDTTKDVELLIKGIELADNMRSDGSDTWISVFKELAKGIPVGDILQKLTELKGQNPQQQMQRRQLPAPQQQFQPNPMQQRQPPFVQPFANNSNAQAGTPAATGQQLEQSMKYLIGKARHNSDPGLYAEWLLDNADKTLIRQMANDPNVLDQLTVIFPALSEPLVRGWFAELVAALQELLAQMPESEDIAPGIAPQSNNANGHDAGSASGHAPDTGRGAGDQNDTQNNAGLG